ncbi:Serine/threonine-protein phosphatase 6 regulatory ankyrin repeat protein [Pyrenophora tritici-repentis]|nr:Serine/threonine-protein phosphatase 6 regulatory ankyrin repeat protein [Pyrenophora tritici-repentis]
MVDALAGELLNLTSHAASRGFTDVAKILLHCGADPYFESQANESPYDIAWTNILSQAWPQDTVEAFRSMFSDPAYLENRQFSLLHKIVLGILAIDLDTMDRARVRSDINRRDKAGKTPLFWAASRKDAAKVRYLLQNGADPNISSLDSRTPMHAAALANDNASIQSLYRYRAVVDACDGNGKTPLQVAASYNGAVELLLDLGADIERSDIHRRAALLHATSRGHMEVVRILVQRGANVSAVERNGCSSFHHAVTGNFQNIFLLLLATNPSAASLVAYGLNDQTIL